MKFNFAHVFSARPPKAETEEEKAEDKDPEETAEGDEEEKAEDKDPEETAEDDEEERAEDDEEEEKAKAAAADKSLSVEKRVAAARKQGRLAERRRIGTILSDKAASGRVEQAVTLAVNTGLPAAAAIETLRASPKSSRLSTLMPGREPRIGADTRGGGDSDKRVASASARYRASRGLKD